MTSWYKCYVCQTKTYHTIKRVRKDDKVDCNNSENYSADINDDEDDAENDHAFVGRSDFHGIRIHGCY